MLCDNNALLNVPLTITEASADLATQKGIAIAPCFPINFKRLDCRESAVSITLPDVTPT
jgi:hypothetical protein